MCPPSFFAHPNNTVAGAAMSYEAVTCPACGTAVRLYRNPLPTVDIIITTGDRRIVLIKRRNPPYGWALPGGFVDYGESLEAAAYREAKEETSLEVSNLRLLGCYSAPRRDERMHTISVVYTADGHGSLIPADDAVEARLFTLEELPDELCFDHARILSDYMRSPLSISA